MIAERFLNASLFFAEKTEKLDTIKLYKLLFLADRECMKRTGHTITESVYRKIKPWGPVPLEAKALVDGIAAGDEDRPSISRFLEVQKQGRNTHISFHGVANLDYFSGEEVRILEKLAAKYRLWPGKRIAHGVHEMRGVKALEWEKDFSMDIFLPLGSKTANQECKEVSAKFRLALVNV
jgi:hypothetical protein